MIRVIALGLLDAGCHALLTGLVLMYVMRRVSVKVIIRGGDDDDGDDDGGEEIPVLPIAPRVSREVMWS